jgi:hypothetical protein
MQGLFKRCTSIRASQCHFCCNLCTKEDSSTGLVRFQTCKWVEGENKRHVGACWWGGKERGMGLRSCVRQKVHDGSTYMICGFDCHAPRCRNLFHTVLTFTAHLVHIRMHSKSITFFKKKKSLKE